MSAPAQPSMKAEVSSSNAASSTALTKSALHRPVVAVDLDEVLGATVEALSRYHNEKHGTELTPESFHSYEFHQVWGGSPEDSVTKMEGFFGSDHFQSLPPIAEAATTLRSLSAFFRFVVVTARQHIIADRTRAWLDQHFPGLFDDVLFGNAYGTTGHKRSKADMCREVGAIALVDDSEKYAAEVAGASPPAVGTAAHPGAVILFGEYAWHTWHRSSEGAAAGAAAGDSRPAPAASAALPRNVIRAVNWRHVHAILLRMRAGPGPAVGVSSGAGAAAAAGGKGSGGDGSGTGRFGSGPGRQTALASDGAPFTPLRLRDAIAINTDPREGRDSGRAGEQHMHRGGGSSSSASSASSSGQGDAASYLDIARRTLELQDSVSLTATGADIRLVGLVADMLARAGDVTLSQLRTGVDAAPPGRPRPPRLTITVQRTATFLRRRFRIGLRRAQGPAAAAAGAAAATGAEEGAAEPGAAGEGRVEGAAASDSRGPLLPPSGRPSRAGSEGEEGELIEEERPEGGEEEEEEAAAGHGGSVGREEERAEAEAGGPAAAAAVVSRREMAGAGATPAALEAVREELAATLGEGSADGGAAPPKA